MPLKLNSTGGGSVTVDVPSTASNYTATLPATTGTVVLADGSNNVSVTNLTASGNVTAGGTVVMSSPFAMRNKIINGAMQIDQRNAGASVTPTDGVYTLDRWYGWANQNSKYTVQQNAASVTPPVGFTNYLGVTSSSAYSVLTGDYFGIVQAIEGLNVQDLAWGTASAKTITVSFWVRSSLTGTFGGVVQNGGQTRSYPFSYTISSANTWEYKTITIAGDTSGTWLTTNGVGVRLAFGLGAGATYSGTANAWASANYVTSTGATSVVGTNGATFYITGVQLEVGTVATPFERRLYTVEELLCKRYFQWVPFSQGFVAPGAGYFFQASVPLVPQMRTVPSFSVVSADPNSSQVVTNNASNNFIAAYSSVNSAFASLSNIGAGNCQVLGYRSQASAEL